VICLLKEADYMIVYNSKMGSKQDHVHMSLKSNLIPLIISCFLYNSDIIIMKSHNFGLFTQRIDL